MKRDIDIAHLRTFLAVVEHKNMTHAAHLRNLTQSAVSQQIKRLEAILDCQVLLRSAGGITLTEAGERLLPEAVSLVRSNDETVALMTGTEVDSDVRLGVPQDIVSSLLPKALGTFHQAYPDIQITLVSASSRQLMQMFKTGQIDLALTTDDNRDDCATVLFKKRLVWIGAIGGQAFKRRPLPVAVGHRECPFRKAAALALSDKKIPWRSVTQVGSLEPVFATLIADMAVSPFLTGTLPAGTEEVHKHLPELPEFTLHLRLPERGLSVSEKSLWDVLNDELTEL